MTRNLSLLTLATLLITGCGGATSSASAAPDTPEAPAFDVQAVIASFEDECRDPAIVDELFCEQVELAGMTAEGDILYVPTTLDPEVEARGEVICDLFTFAHFDAEGTDLGYEFVGILDRDGGNLAACSVT